MNKIFFIATLLIASAFADIWSNCGKSSDHLKINNVVITPDPPAIGKNLTVTATGTLDEVITGGTIVVDLTYDGFLPVLNNTFDLCTMLGQFGLHCPLPSGQTTVTVSQLIPGIAPAGSYAGKIVGFDQHDQEVICIALNFNMSAMKAKKPVASHDRIKVVNKNF